MIQCVWRHLLELINIHRLTFRGSIVYYFNYGIYKLTEEIQMLYTLSNIHRVFNAPASSPEADDAKSGGGVPAPRRDDKDVQDLNAKPADDGADWLAGLGGDQTTNEPTEAGETSADDWFAKLDPEIAKELGDMEGIEAEFKLGDAKPEGAMIISRAEAGDLAPIVENFLEGLTPEEEKSIYDLIPLEQARKGAFEDVMWSAGGYESGITAGRTKKGSNSDVGHDGEVKEGMVRGSHHNITLGDIETIVNRAKSLDVTVQQYVAYERAAAALENKEPAAFDYPGGDTEKAAKQVQSTKKTLDGLGIILDQQGMTVDGGLDVAVDLIESGDLDQFNEADGDLDEDINLDYVDLETADELEKEKSN